MRINARNELNPTRSFVPASCTGELQPLDVGVNEQLKSVMREDLSRWNAKEIQEAMRQGVSLSDIKIDLRGSLYTQIG